MEKHNFRSVITTPELMGTVPSNSRRTVDQTLIGIYWGYDAAAGFGTPPPSLGASGQPSRTAQGYIGRQATATPRKGEIICWTRGRSTRRPPGPASHRRRSRAALSPSRSHSSPPP